MFFEIMIFKLLLRRYMQYCNIAILTIIVKYLLILRAHFKNHRCVVFLLFKRKSLNSSLKIMISKKISFKKARVTNQLKNVILNSLLHLWALRTCRA